MLHIDIIQDSDNHDYQKSNVTGIEKILTMFAWLFSLKNRSYGFKGEWDKPALPRRKITSNLTDYTEHVVATFKWRLHNHVNYQKAMMMIWKEADIFSQNSGQCCLKTLSGSFFPLLPFISTLCAAASWEIKNIYVTHF